MLNCQEIHDEKDMKKRSKSRKIIKNRNDSFTMSNKTENNKELNQSPVSLNKKHSNTPVFGEFNTELGSINQYKSKIKELSDDKQNLLDAVNSNEKEIDFLNSIIYQFVDLNEFMMKMQGFEQYLILLFNIEKRFFLSFKEHKSKKQSKMR